MKNRLLLLQWRERWNRTLLSFLKQRVRARVDIEDLAQETYLRLLRAPDLRDVRNPQAYLLKIASHVIAEWHHQRMPTEEGLEDEDGLLVDDCTPEFQLDARLSAERLDAVLASISPMMRAVLLLRLRDERPYKEIAQELGLTDRQVKRYLARGYERRKRVACTTFPPRA